MRKFTEPETIAISGILKIEALCLAFGRAIKPILDDADLKKLWILKSWNWKQESQTY